MGSVAPSPTVHSLPREPETTTRLDTPIGDTIFLRKLATENLSHGVKGKVKVETAAHVVLLDDIERVRTQHARIVCAIA